MDSETVVTVITIVSPVAALILWLIRSTVAPMKVVIENNTKAMDRVVATLDKHDEKLIDHEGRIIKIETVHEMEEQG